MKDSELRKAERQPIKLFEIIFPLTEEGGLMDQPKTNIEDNTMYFQSLNKVFERIRLGIVTLETIKESRWNTTLGKKYAKLLEELIVCFNQKLNEKP